jgi:hypothetical protein
MQPCLEVKGMNNVLFNSVYYDSGTKVRDKLLRASPFGVLFPFRVARIVFLLCDMKVTAMRHPEQRVARNNSWNSMQKERNSKKER